MITKMRIVYLLTAALFLFAPFNSCIKDGEMSEEQRLAYEQYLAEHAEDEATDDSSGSEGSTGTGDLEYLNSLQDGDECLVTLDMVKSDCGIEGTVAWQEGVPIVNCSAARASNLMGEEILTPVLAFDILNWVDNFKYLATHMSDSITMNSWDVEDLGDLAFITTVYPFHAIDSLEELDSSTAFNLFVKKGDKVYMFIGYPKDLLSSTVVGCNIEATKKIAKQVIANLESENKSSTSTD